MRFGSACWLGLAGGWAGWLGLAGWLGWAGWLVWAGGLGWVWVYGSGGMAGMGLWVYRIGFDTSMYTYI